ncbi:DmcB [Staphylococcus phage Twort]|uniref:ORF222 n=2 Tax=Staphylococcus phage Twort (strain DSM 17442 / HER 48) TaxID=2908167 RepID=Q4Z8Y5_BPTWO|nr:ORF222 [Staphylococcus phage Twort]AAX92468.1 ORF222 [Staphylococcus phage Twort]QIW89079.1 DmcB [Staphylococcus phage Twort]
MIKYVEITMASGKKYFLIGTEDNPVYDTDLNAYMSSARLFKVYTENSLTSGRIYINPNRIESFKLFY